MTKNRHFTAVAAIAATALAAGAATTIAASSGDTRAYQLRSTAAPVVGVDGKTAFISTRVSFPTSWRVAKRTKSTLTIREGSAQCAYTIKVSHRVAAGDEADASARVFAQRPADGAYVLDSGARNSAAWRVTRIKGNPIVRIEALRASPLRYASQQAGRKLWLETVVSARSDVGDECHSGTVRDVAGPSIGDALATARVRAYLNR